ncbi:type I polyketide synthase [Actinocrispum wychmicini]|uniref:Acyl transferase domain-containing protein n=1 Tax=Actinocrispum wychmicini TaxID=1213861 RepID=A0A4R2JQQ8_9PSEU|nr:type I polyketide synthase [Actinocrispum wychmicini]TCO59528.1 acyl transferase domain-containing protein [Actinocrispum wychmicini]
MTADFEAIAVIGAGARLPGAATVSEFWRNLRAGTDSISRFDPGTLRAAGVSEQLIADPDYVPARGVLAGGEDFDWRFFGYSAAEARTIDPQQRVFLEVCRAACDDAGVDPARFPGWIGVFAGGDVTTTGTGGPLTIERVIGAEKDFLATRVAYKLGLRGPAITVQTACSTSLVAVHQASQSLLNHECDAALAGGVSLWLPQNTGYRYEPDHILSVDGRCRPFDADSSGTVSSNGAAVVMLRRLSDAIDDGDRIMAVLRGSALNNDGGEKIGYTAPSLTGQRDVIRLALAQSDVDPADLAYVEAHGTATQIGDPVELAALTSAFRQSTDRVGDCWIGSVKSNIGHTGAASGVAGLLKTVLQLEHRELVPSLHFARPNPKLDLDSSPFQVITETRPLPEDGPVLAAVSSFGIGGTNAHAVLETPPRSARGGRGPKVFCLSASSRDALKRAGAALADRLDNPHDPVSVAWTLTSGRPSLPYRASVTDANSLRDLDGVEAGSGRVAFVFPGQGALYPGAIEAAYDVLPLFRKVFDEAAEVVREHHGIDLRAMIAPGAPEEPLRDSLVQQLGLFSIGYALGREVLSWGVRPVAMLGHSAGEYVAAALAGVWDLADGLALVAARAQAMRQGPPGGMIAVYASPAEVAELASGYDLTVATEGPGQVVLAGGTESVERLAARLAGTSVNATVLDADRPFHTEAMRPAAGELRAALDRSPPGQARLPVVSNLTGRLADPQLLADRAYWADHMCGRVRLTEGMATLLDEGCAVVIELGPGQTMSGGLRRHEQWAATAVPVIGRATEPRHEALLGALGRLWETGVPVGWDTLFTERPVRCSLPPVQLDSRPCPVDAPTRPPSTHGMVVVGDPAVAEDLVAQGAQVTAVHVTTPREPLAGPLNWPDSGPSLSSRPDLVAALDNYAASLLAVDTSGSGRLAEFVRTIPPAGPVDLSALDEVAGLRDLVRHCAQSYPDVLAGRVEPVSVLYPHGSDRMLHELLTGNKVPVSDSESCLEAVRRSIPAWHGGEPLRVLEIGAGRGGLTWPLLDAWTDREHVQYDVTDVSPHLVSELDSRIKERGEPRVRARVFDITADPAAQRLVSGTYDLILGYNVVHVAPSVPLALNNLRRLLRADGTLCLVELTRAEIWTHVVWGLAPGWWNAADDLRGMFPQLDIAGWTKALTSGGFDLTTAEGPTGNADHAVLVATLADRDRLREPMADIARQTPSAPPPASSIVDERRTVTVPGDPLTAELSALWCSALGVSSAAPDDDFYRLGGESLGIVHLLGRVHEQTGVRVPMTEFAAAPTFGALLDKIRASHGPTSPNILRLNETGDGVPLFLAAPGAGSTLCYRHLIAELGGREPVYGFESPGLHDDAEPLNRIEDMAAANLLLLKEIQPHGPYRVGGWSIGAMIAHEMAAQLLDQGEQVDQLLCVDSFAPRTWFGPVGSRPGYLARGLWYQLQTALPVDKSGNLGAALGLAGVQELGPAYVRVYNANVRAMLRYVPRPVDCPAVVFKTGLTEHVRRRVRRETSTTCPRGIRLVGVPGDHHSMLRPRHAAVLAARVRAVLDESPPSRTKESPK